MNSPPQMRRGWGWWEGGSDLPLNVCDAPKAQFGQIVPPGLTCPFGTSQGSKNQGGAYVTPYFGGMYAPSGHRRRHTKLRHVCATREWRGREVKADC